MPLTDPEGGCSNHRSVVDVDRKSESDTETEHYHIHGGVHAANLELEA